MYREEEFKSSGIAGVEYTFVFLAFFFRVLWLYECGSLHRELKILNLNIQDVPFSMSLSTAADANLLCDKQPSFCHTIKRTDYTTRWCIEDKGPTP